MLGFDDFQVWLAYVLCIASALACVAWGAWRWNYAGGGPDEPEEEVRHWAEEEDKVEEKF